MNNILRKPFRYSYNGAVFWIIGINVLVFALMMLVGNRIIYLLEIDPAKLDLEKLAENLARYGVRLRQLGNPPVWPITVERALSMSPMTVVHGYIWTVVTYMFMHGGVMHLLFNMFGLYIFGTHTERQMGSKEFLLYYLVTGIFAGVFSFAVYFFTGQYIVALVGASGALFAVMLAYAVFFPDSIIYIWGILPLRAPVLVLGYTALELFFQISGGRGNVAHLTHLAGFAFGWIYFMVRYGVNPWRRLVRRG